MRKCIPIPNSVATMQFFTAHLKSFSYDIYVFYIVGFDSIKVLNLKK